MRRTAPPIRSGVLVLHPRDGRRGVDLPPMEVVPPTDGWSLDAAVAASWAYASGHGLGRGAAVRAFQALARECCSGLTRAEQVTRLSGVDHFRPGAVTGHR